MARISPIEKENVPKDMQDVLTEIEGAFGKVPNLFKTYSHFPPLLKVSWEKVKAVMMQGSLTRKTKETIAVLISKDNSCKYCVAAHTMALKSIGVTESEIQAIEADIGKAGFTEKEFALIAFARKANKTPLEIRDKEFEGLKKVGTTDSEIVEALGVMELFAGFNKFLDSLRVEIDF
jgi:uncharacterized peroxidase-related enzyme